MTMTSNDFVWPQDYPKRRVSFDRRNLEHLEVEGSECLCVCASVHEGRWWWNFVVMVVVVAAVVLLWSSHSKDKPGHPRSIPFLQITVQTWNIHEDSLFYWGCLPLDNSYHSIVTIVSMPPGLRASWGSLEEGPSVMSCAMLRSSLGNRRQIYQILTCK